MDSSGRAELAGRIGEAVINLVADLVHAVGRKSEDPDSSACGEELLTTKEAAALARRTPETIRAWARSKRLAEVGGEGPPLYRRADLEAAIARPGRAARPRRQETAADRADQILRSLG